MFMLLGKCDAARKNICYPADHGDDSFWEEVLSKDGSGVRGVREEGGGAMRERGDISECFEGG